MIDDFIDRMCQKLPIEIISHIIKKFIYLPKNVTIICKQKVLQEYMLQQLLFISNILYIDDGCCVYVNNNDIIIHNNHTNVQLYPASNFLNVQNHVNDLPFQNMYSDINYATYNSNLLSQINANIETIQNNLNMSLGSYFTSNYVLHTTHQDMDNVVFYIMYI